MQHSHLPGRILWFMFPETEIRYPPREMVARGHKWIRFPQTWVSTGSSVPSIFPHPFPLDGTPRIEKESTMYKHLVYALLLLCATGIWAYGQDPDLQASDANSPPSGPALSPAPTPVDQASNQALSFDESCGCQSTTSCAPYGSVYQRPSLKEKCAYYRAIRQSYRDEPCCGDYFGGFGRSGSRIVPTNNAVAGAKRLVNRPQLAPQRSAAGTVPPKCDCRSCIFEGCEPAITVPRETSPATVPAQVWECPRTHHWKSAPRRHPPRPHRLPNQRPRPNLMLPTTPPLKKRLRHAAGGSSGP